MTRIWISTQDGCSGSEAFNALSDQEGSWLTDQIMRRATRIANRILESSSVNSRLDNPRLVEFAHNMLADLLFIPTPIAKSTRFSRRTADQPVLSWFHVAVKRLAFDLLREEDAPQEGDERFTARDDGPLDAHQFVLGAYTNMVQEIKQLFFAARVRYRVGLWLLVKFLAQSDLDSRLFVPHAAEKMHTSLEITLGPVLQTLDVIAAKQQGQITECEAVPCALFGDEWASADATSKTILRNRWATWKTRVTNVEGLASVIARWDRNYG